jgi:hypothetical protein
VSHPQTLKASEESTPVSTISGFPGVWFEREGTGVPTGDNPIAESSLEYTGGSKASN